MTTPSPETDAALPRARRRGYYQSMDGREDALVLKLALPVKSGG